MEIRIIFLIFRVQFLSIPAVFCPAQEMEAVPLVSAGRDFIRIGIIQGNGAVLHGIFPVHAGRNAVLCAITVTVIGVIGNGISCLPPCGIQINFFPVLLRHAAELLPVCINHIIALFFYAPSFPGEPGPGISVLREGDFFRIINLCNVLHAAFCLRRIPRGMGIPAVVGMEVHAVGNFLPYRVERNRTAVRRFQPAYHVTRLVWCLVIPVIFRIFRVPFFPVLFVQRPAAEYKAVSFI